jgi:hypothetical protein
MLPEREPREPRTPFKVGFWFGIAFVVFGLVGLRSTSPFRWIVSHNQGRLGFYPLTGPPSFLASTPAVPDLRPQLRFRRQRFAPHCMGT